MVDSTGASGDSDLSDGLVGLWHMNEASWNGTANEVTDSSGNGNHGVRTGVAITSDSGVFSRSADLEPGGAIDISGFSSTAKTYTFSFWIKPQDNTVASYLFDSSVN